MPAPHPVELRERVVLAYERGNDSFEKVAELFGVARAALQRWVKRQRETRSVQPSPRGGGNFSPIDLPLLEGVLSELGDATTHELTAEYNRRVGRSGRVHRSSIHRALRRAGYVFKKNSFVRENRRGRTSKTNDGASSDD